MNMIPIITFKKWPSEFVSKKLELPIEYLFYRTIKTKDYDIHLFSPNGCIAVYQFGIVENDLELAKCKAIEAIVEKFK